MPKKKSSRRRPPPQPRGPRAKHLPKNPDGRVRPRSKPPSQRPPARMTQAEYARHRGVTRQMVSKAISMGIIPVDRRGRIEPKQADRAWEANSAAAAAMKQHGTLAETPDGRPITYASARAMHEYYKAELAKLELGERSGELVPLSDVADVASTAARAARDLLYGISDRTAEVLCPEDPDRARRVIDAEVNRIIAELSMDELGVEHDQRKPA